MSLNFYFNSPSLSALPPHVMVVHTVDSLPHSMELGINLHHDLDLDALAGVQQPLGWLREGNQAESS